MGQMTKVCRNNTSIATDDGVTRITLHGTTVVEFDAERIILRTGGYDTVTTRARMNQAANEYGLGYRVYREKGETMVKRRDGYAWPLGSEINFRRSN